MTITVSMEDFGKTHSGETVSLFTLKNSKGLSALVTNYGGIITAVKAPDREGRFEDITLGFDSLAGYLGKHPHFGATTGRYANRIGKARFTLEGREYFLPANDGQNSLHGGPDGFDKKLWRAEESMVENTPCVRMSYTSKDGEEGYPGNLAAQVTFTLTDGNELKIAYSATTDRATVINLTNHSYFNLSPALPDILGHVVTINADTFTPVDESLIPTGELRPVPGTPMDFRTPHSIGERISADDEQLFIGNGYDHNWVINGAAGTLRFAARAEENTSGRILEVYTTEPGMQLYTGNFLDGTIKGKGGRIYGHRSGFCFETQHFPDSPNRPDFPSTVLRPGQTFNSETVYKFLVE